MTYAKTKFHPKTSILEILIDVDTYFLYIIEVQVVVKPHGHVFEVNLMNIVKARKFVKPHIFNHFNCEFSKNYILCQASSFTWDSKPNVNMMAWSRKEPEVPVVETSTQPRKLQAVEDEGIYPYKLKYLLKMNPMMSVALENYDEDIITYLRCQTGKVYAQIQTEKLTEDIKLHVDIPASIPKPYDLTFGM